MPRLRPFLLAAVLPFVLHQNVAAQNPTPPRKRLNVINQGMTPAQVRAVLGEPARVRTEGGLVYMYYPNGRGAASEDYVVIRDCRVVGARFENPNRFVVRRGAVDETPPPEAECRTGAEEPPVAVVAPPAPPAETPTPRDAGPQPTLVPTQPTAPEPELAQQDPAAWRRELSLRRPSIRTIAVPSASISSPTAFGLDLGEGFIGVGYQERTRFTSLDDAAAAIGVGLGDRQRYVGVEVTATSYSTLRGNGPFETGSLSFKLHRAFGDTWGVAAGVENVVDWGGVDTGRSPFGTVTHLMRWAPVTRPFSAAVATVGVGSGRFRTESNVAADKKNVNVFGALGVQLAQPLSAVADWNGQDLFAGVSLAPVRHVPLVINAGLADITGSAGDGTRFILSAGLGFRWLPPFVF